jgi:ACS family hexuronate transporter-like MFS transporter
MGREPGSAVDPPQGPPPPAGGGFRHYRWVICALLFFATTVNYVDRQVLGILAPTLGKEIGWNEVQYGHIVTSFQVAYAVGLLLAGRAIDWMGTRLGYSVALVIWSLAAMAHGLARTVVQFACCRFVLGFGEAGNFPAAVKTVAEWFPRRERALATGIFNAGSNVGAIVAPATVPWIALNWGWEWAFYITGGLGLFWLVAWVPLYRRPTEHPRITPEELRHVVSDGEEPADRLSWVRLLGCRQTWALMLGRFLTDAVWWFYLYWTPKFLDSSFKVSLKEVCLPLVVIYLVADVGSIGGGWLSSHWIKRGWSVNAARKTAMLICAVCILPVTYAPHASNQWVAIGLISLAAAAHQGWSANVFTLVSDMFPRRAVGTIVGVGGMAGAVGGILLSQTIGHILQWTGSYIPIFFIAGVTYMAAFVLIHVLAPRLKPIEV